MPRKNDRVDDWNPESGRDTRRLTKEIGQGFQPAAKRGRKKTVKGVKLRVISGELRGRPIPYHGDDLTRPMKDKTREALFNILGKCVKGTIAIDLFAGTGALAIESISRGSTSAIAIEQNTRAADTIRQTAVSLGIEEKLQVITGDAFRVASTIVGLVGIDDPETMPPPQIVYVCPPYAMWEIESDRLLQIVRIAVDRCPIGSWIVIETERWFDLETLPGTDWDIRTYGNTVLGFYRPALICGGDL